MECKEIQEKLVVLLDGELAPKERKPFCGMCVHALIA
jgi:hypothetical protein